MEQILRVFPNGLRLVLNKTDSQCGSVLVRVLKGVEHEKKSLSGIASVVENALLFESKKNEHNLRLCGGKFFAGTYVDAIEFGSECFVEKTLNVIDILSEIIFGCKFEQSLVSRSVAAVLQQQNEYSSEYDVLAFDLLRKMMFSGLGLDRNVFGKASSLQKLKPSEVKEFWQKALHPKNIIVCVSANVDLDKLYEKVFEAFYSKLLKIDGKKEKPSSTQSSLPDKVFEMKKAKINQSRVCVGFLTNGERDDKHVLSLIAEILDSELGKAFENVDGIYASRVAVRSYAKNGMFYVSFAADEESVLPALDVCAKTFVDYYKNQISMSKFNERVAIYRSKFLLPLESSKTLCRRSARFLGSTEKIFNLKKELSEIDSIGQTLCKNELGLLLKQKVFASIVGKSVDENLAAYFEKKLKS